MSLIMNLVEIGNKSCLIDVTWGAGITTSKHDFVKKYDEFYLCTPPEIFIRNHLPQESQSDMQGIEPKVSFDEFINMAETLKSFYKLGYTAVTPDLKTIVSISFLAAKLELISSPIRMAPSSWLLFLKYSKK